MPRVKFLAPLRPEQVFIIRFVASGARGIRFECIRDEDPLLVQGYITVASGDG